jgi:hypothetical protein
MGQPDLPRLLWIFLVSDKIFRRQETGDRRQETGVQEFRSSGVTE